MRLTGGLGLGRIPATGAELAEAGVCQKCVYRGSRCVGVLADKEGTVNWGCGGVVTRPHDQGCGLSTVGIEKQYKI